MLGVYSNTVGSAAFLSNQVYSPYGTQLSSNGNAMSQYTNKGFTGQYNDPTSGLDYYVSRYYDPVSGVFLSADAVQGNLAGLNPYTYAGGNPETYNDPTGQAFIPPEGGGGGSNTGGNSGGSGMGNSGGNLGSGGGYGGYTGGYTGGSTGGSNTSGSPCGGCAFARDTLPQGEGGIAAEAQGALAGGDSQEIMDYFNTVTTEQQQLLTEEAEGEITPEDVAIDEEIANVEEQTIKDITQEKQLEEAIADGTAVEAVGNGGELNTDTSTETTNTTDTHTETNTQIIQTNNEGEQCSFMPATLVATDHGEQAISKLHVGQKVLAYNSKTHKMEDETILHVWIHKDNDLVDLTLTTKIHAPHSTVATTTKETIHTNKKHPFFTLEKGFVPVGQLKLGMHVLRADGRIGIITGYHLVLGSALMYNLTVANDHSYTVGVGKWIVHNCAKSNTSGNNSSAQRGNQFHYDLQNGGPAQIQAMYPQTDFNFKPMFQPGPDVEVVGGVHPSDPNVYPGTTWRPGSDFADFKPDTASGQRTFQRDIQVGKLPPGTVPIWYNQAAYIITRIGPWVSWCFCDEHMLRWMKGDINHAIPGICGHSG